MKFEAAEMKIILIEQDILTVSPGGANGKPEDGWGELDFPN